MIVFDASTLVGAVISATSKPRYAFDRAISEARLALSKPIYDEIVEVLYRIGLQRFVRPELRAELLNVFAHRAVWFEPTINVDECRDWKDNKYLELALAAGASTIVSSDNDLLVLNPWRGVRIVRPAEYLTSQTA